MLDANTIARGEAGVGADGGGAGAGEGEQGWDEKLKEGAALAEARLRCPPPSTLNHKP